MQFTELLSDSGLKLTVCDYGARIVGIEVPHQGKPTQLALGYNTPEDYLQDNAYLGATVGPIANRLAGGVLSIDGERFRLPANEGNNCLHSGNRSFDKLFWQLAEQSDRHVTFSLDYPEVAGSLPGNLQLTATYSVAGGQFEIDYRATTDRATFLNLTNHVYLNLNSDEQTVHNHEFTVYAHAYAEKKADGIPTGRAIELTKPFNYALQETTAYPDLKDSLDHHFLVDENSAELKQLASIRSPQSCIGLEVSSTKPGFQAYTGQSLKAPFSAFDGFCIEPQFAPNAINNPAFISPLTTPQKSYHHHHIFAFDWSD